MSMQNISGLANTASPGQSSANAWEDQLLPAFCLLCMQRELLYRAFNTMLCCEKTVLGVDNITLSFCDGVKNSKELKIGKGGKKRFLLTNSISMGSEIITHGSPSSQPSLLLPLAFKFEKSWV